MQQKRYLIPNIIYFVILSAVSVGLFFYYENFCGYDMYIHADAADAFWKWKGNLEVLKGAGLPVLTYSYPLMYLGVKACSVIFRVDILTAISVIMVMSILFSILVYRFLILDMMPLKNDKSVIIANVLSVLAVFFEGCRSPLTEMRFYALQGAPNPIHNPTILFVRPFGLLSIYFFIHYIEACRNNRNCVKNLILFGLFSLLGVLSKPSFAFVYLPAMAIVVLVEIILEKRGIEIVKFAGMTLLSVVPSIIVLLFQFWYGTKNSEVMEFHISFGSYANFTALQVLMVSVATFPIVLIAFRPKLLTKDRYYLLGVSGLLIGWMEMFFLTNGLSGDFSWGYDLAVQIGTVIALVMVYKYEYHKVMRCIVYSVFAYQVFCGVWYWVLAFQGKNPII